MKKLFFNLAILILIFISLPACSVAPWERGNLAKPHMAATPYPMQSKFRGHNYMSREAAPSNSGSGVGGGCGCY